MEIVIRWRTPSLLCGASTAGGETAITDVFLFFEGVCRTRVRGHRRHPQFLGGCFITAVLVSSMERASKQIIKKQRTSFVLN